jgi:RNA 2',3'-cyclic 3'-phosphodiesterase
VESNPALMKLHAAIAEALLPTGYLPEPRPFHPHITLARCEPRTPRSAIDDFLRQHAGESLPPFAVIEFALYSSQTGSAGSVYVRERTYPLSSGSSR